MYLSKKSLMKIAIVAAVYFALGSIAVLLWIVFDRMGVGDPHLLAVGVGVYLFCPVAILFGIYAEGKGKLIALGNKLVRRQLRPAEFLTRYERLSTAGDLVIRRPSMEVLQMAATAYDLLDDREKALAAADGMIAAAKEKKKGFARFFKASLLYSYDRWDEAEELFGSRLTQRPDIASTVLADTILKSDRAMAMGDDKTVEAYGEELLGRSFPRLDALGRLVIHYQMGEACEGQGETAKAAVHYRYCAQHGGETAIRRAAAEKLQQSLGG